MAEDYRIFAENCRKYSLLRTVSHIWPLSSRSSGALARAVSIESYSQNHSPSTRELQHSFHATRRRGALPVDGAGGFTFEDDGRSNSHTHPPTFLAFNILADAVALAVDVRTAQAAFEVGHEAAAAAEGHGVGCGCRSCSRHCQFFAGAARVPTATAAIIAIAIIAIIAIAVAIAATTQ
jgi:hypothetical protein